MPKQSLIKKLLERRIHQILGSYLVAGTSLILFIEYLVDKYQFPSHYPTLALFALIGILPSVVIIAYFHGAPGKDEWTKVEKVGIPINVFFIASILFRGIKWNFIPTTILAQCDSCIGGKTSINFDKYKNQLGNFYPPQKIFLDPNLLKTLKIHDFGIP